MLAAILICGTSGFASCGNDDDAAIVTPAANEYFTQWNQCEALTALQNYVKDVTDPTSPNFIKAEDRIATFDMDGTFDWFGPESHPDFCGNPETGEYTGDNSKSPANPKRSITPEQFQNRMILRQAMLRHGFKPFDTEWWHFTLKDEPFPDTYFTFPVKQLNK